jgi:hypothetical protein
VCVCVCVCARACVRARVCVCGGGSTLIMQYDQHIFSFRRGLLYILFRNITIACQCLTLI